MPDPDPELLERTQATKPADPGVADCWDMVLDGVRYGWLDRDNIPELVEYIGKDSSWGNEELVFEVGLDGLLYVKLLKNNATCQPAAMIAELQKLLGPKHPAGAPAQPAAPAAGPALGSVPAAPAPAKPSPLKRATTVPPASRAAIQKALRAESDHAEGLPDPLPLGRVLWLTDKAKQSTERTKILGGQDERGFFLDYYRVDNDGQTSWHGRIRDDGKVEELENIEGQLGYRASADPEETKREKARITAHNDRAREILKKKGFL